MRGTPVVGWPARERELELEPEPGGGGGSGPDSGSGRLAEGGCHLACWRLASTVGQVAASSTQSQAQDASTGAQEMQVPRGSNNKSRWAGNIQ